MSGTSLDGLDMACSTFSFDKVWSYKIVKAQTIKYPLSWRRKLATAHALGGEELIELDHQYGQYVGKACAGFIARNNLKVDFISSHGHTIFHQPDRGFTFQLGNGNAIHAVTGVPVVYDFRSLDVTLGGEGAPLVPVGDKFLFHDYDVCLNMGGIANISMDVRKTRMAFDVCFCNMPLNYLASKAGKDFDAGGKIAVRGAVHIPLLKKLSRIYQSLKRTRPSLGREIFESRVQPLLDDESISLPDRMRTCLESTSIEIVDAIKSYSDKAKVLCTGGGAFNPLLIARLLEHGDDNITMILPDDDVINYKEAMVFAFLGVLRVRGRDNCLKSVTRATRDSSGGVMVGFDL